MGFLAPGMLGLLGLASVPVIIHLLNRRRYQVVKWPAMRFLLNAEVKTKQRLRVENLILLILRTLAVLLLAIVAARPFLPSARAIGVLGGPERRHLYLLVDNSASMGYQEGMSPLLQRAKSAAESAVGALRSDDPVTLVVACDEQRRNGKPRALLRKTVDHGKVREVLSRIQVTHGRMDPAAALAEVAAVAEPGDPRRSLLVLSDFARSDWSPYATDAAPAAKAEGAKEDAGTEASRAILTQIERLDQLRFELDGAFRFLGDPEVEDFAVLDIRSADGRAPVEGMPASFEVTVGNNGPGPATADVKFLVDDREVASQRVSVRGRPVRSPLAETARVSFTWTATAGGHVVEAEASGAGNRLRANDRRGHAFQVRRRVAVLLVDGDPNPPPHRLPETWLLETALSLRRGVVPAEVRVIPGADLPRERLDRHDVVVLAGLDRVPEETWDRIATFVRRGGGLWIFLSEKTDPIAWNAAVVRAGNGALLPARLAAKPREVPDEPLAVDLTASTHPSLRDLTDPRAGTSFEPPLVQGWWPLEAAPEEGTETLLRLRDLAGSPWLLERAHGRGRTMLCVSTADLDWTGPSLLFAPLAQEAVSWLASAGEEPRDLLVHGTIVCEVPEEARNISASAGRSDNDSQFSGDIEPIRREGDEEGTREVVFSETAVQGRVTIRWESPSRDGGIGAPAIREERVYAVNLDPREADTARLRAGDLEERFQRKGLAPRGDPGAEAEARERERDAQRGDLTRPALALGLLCLLAEMFLASFFGRRRR